MGVRPSALSAAGRQQPGKAGPRVGGGGHQRHPLARRERRGDRPPVIGVAGGHRSAQRRYRPGCPLHHPPNLWGTHRQPRCLAPECVVQHLLRHGAAQCQRLGHRDRGHALTPTARPSAAAAGPPSALAPAVGQPLDGVGLRLALTGTYEVEQAPLCHRQARPGRTSSARSARPLAAPDPAADSGGEQRLWRHRCAGRRGWTARLGCRSDHGGHRPHHCRCTTAAAPLSPHHCRCATAAARLAAPCPCTHPCNPLIPVEGIGQAVVGAGVQAQNAFAPGAAGPRRALKPARSTVWPCGVVATPPQPPRVAMSPCVAAATASLPGTSAPAR